MNALLLDVLFNVHLSVIEKNIGGGLYSFQRRNDRVNI